jgi:hypothetical protein
MTKKIVLLASFICMFVICSCELGDFNLQDDPNSLKPEDVLPDPLLNEIQYQFQLVLNSLVTETDRITRYQAMVSTNYAGIVDRPALEGEWSNMYSMKTNVGIINGLAESNPDIRFHRGIATVLSNYLYAIMVDYNGNIPLSEANNPVEFPNPKLDSGVDVYNKVLADIDLAIEDFNNATFIPTTDLYYGGDTDKWIRLANSLKLRLLVQKRLVDPALATQEINALISSATFIETADQDFQFQYSTELEPEGRHVYFRRGYDAGGSITYLGNYFMALLKDSKQNPDPRLRYYVYRQSNNVTPFVLCSSNPSYEYCYIGDSYLGRDHGDTQASVGENLQKTTWGIYPGGGAFDSDTFQEGPDLRDNGSTLNGAGILPILHSSFVSFLRAEASLALGTTGDAVTFLEQGIRNSMSKVMNFGVEKVDPAFAMTDTDVNAYVAEVLANYNSAATDTEKLDIIIKEYYLAAFGNSVEAYNFYRRTGLPSNFQVPVFDQAIPFPRSWYYPENSVNRNSSIDQKIVTEKVFWDTNPDGFIN